MPKEFNFTIADDHVESLTMPKANLTRATNLTLRLAKPGLQYVTFCDANFHGTRFVLKFEVCLIHQNGQE